MGANNWQAFRSPEVPNFPVAKSKFEDIDIDVDGLPDETRSGGSSQHSTFNIRLATGNGQLATCNIHRPPKQQQLLRVVSDFQGKTNTPGKIAGSRIVDTLGAENDVASRRWRCWWWRWRKATTDLAQELLAPTMVGNKNMTRLGLGNKKE